MKKVMELNLGSNDAEDYRRRENKQMFNEIFIKDRNLEKLLDLNTYFLLGEKGTGKTAYAVFLSNNEYKNTRSQLKYIRETEYRKFINLKAEKHLVLSDYTSIWKVIILVLIAEKIESDDIANPFSRNQKLQAIRSAIDEYYQKAFSPEIVNVLKIVDNTKEAAELMLKYLKLGITDSQEVSFSESKFQLNLQYIERSLCSALDDIRLKFNNFLFIDGVDIRPEGIPYKDYLDCVKGLSDAVWSLNNDIFSVIKGSEGRFKVVLLLRPDIFESIGLQNSTNKIRNNSVFLDWRTTIPEHRESKLFELSDKLLSFQQEQRFEIGITWDRYFPWTSQSTSPEREYDTPFINMLRLSYSRPRDIVTILLLLQEIVDHKNIQNDFFPYEVFRSSEFKNAFSEYLMGGIKDQLAFYYTKEDYEMLLHFLSFFKGRSDFDYDFYKEKYKEYADYILKKATDLPEFIDTQEMFLQFLYDSNIISYIEEIKGKQYFRFCYRERNISNLSPKVIYGARYRFHYGLLRALNLG